MSVNSEAAVICCSGLDPSGGAGIAADIRAVEAQQVKALICLSARTIQNNRKFYASYPTPADEFRQTLELLLEDFPRAVIKTGMLPQKAHVDIILNIARKRNDSILVVDPVIISSSGGRLIDHDAEEAILTKLLPVTTVFTPNIPETEALTDISIKNEADIHQAGQQLLKCGARNVIIKGGHLQGEAVDYLFNSQGLFSFSHSRVPGSARGTGCSFASATAAALAKGNDIQKSIQLAKDYVLTLFK